MRKLSVFGVASVTSLLLAGANTTVYADIYGFVDEDGVSHFSSIQVDERYTLFLKEPEPEVSAANRANAQLQSDYPLSNNGNRKRFSPLIAAVAEQHQLDSALLHAVITVESAYNPHAVSPKGATGLMQLMPGTARRYAVTNIKDPAENLRGGARYLRDLIQMFGNNLSLALAAYNAGEKAVVRYGNSIPPYQETRSYVPKVLELYRRYGADKVLGSIKKVSIDSARNLVPGQLRAELEARSLIESPAASIN